MREERRGERAIRLDYTYNKIQNTIPTTKYFAGINENAFARHWIVKLSVEAFKGFRGLGGFHIVATLYLLTALKNAYELPVPFTTKHIQHPGQKI